MPFRCDETSLHVLVCASVSARLSAQNANLEGIAGNSWMISGRLHHVAAACTSAAECRALGIGAQKNLAFISFGMATSDHSTWAIVTCSFLTIYDHVVPTNRFSRRNKRGACRTGGTYSTEQLQNHSLLWFGVCVSLCTAISQGSNARTHTHKGNKTKTKPHIGGVSNSGPSCIEKYCPERGKRLLV